MVEIKGKLYRHVRYSRGENSPCGKLCDVFKLDCEAVEGFRLCIDHCILKETEEKIEQEELYICDHVTEDCNCVWSKPHDFEIVRNRECAYKEIFTQSIPYKKDEEVYENQDSDIASSIHYPYCWDTMAYPTLASALWEIASPVGMACSECGQAFYQPTKRETVGEVMASMPLIHSYAKDEDDRIPSDPEGYFNDMLDFYDRLKAAQDRNRISHTKEVV